MSRIAVIVGSLRRESYNRRLAHALTKLPAAQGHSFTFPEISDLPLYNQDDDADKPAPAVRLKREIRAVDGVIFVTPEYNRSIPGVLKNALDHASRPTETAPGRESPPASSAPRRARPAPPWPSSTCATCSPISPCPRSASRKPSSSGPTT